MEDGDELLLTLALPLDMRLFAELVGAIDAAARRRGFTSVSMLTDGTNRIVARREDKP